MTDQHLSLSDKQLKTAEVLSSLDMARADRQMAWIFFSVLTVLFVANSGLLIYSAFSQNGISIAKVVMIAFDGLLGTLVTRVTWYLFPRRCKDKDGIIREIAPSKES